jgi:hypothetical protein
VAEFFRVHGPAYLDAHGLHPHRAKVLRAVIACRTSALGGHLWRCRGCGHELPAYNACRDRHCPTCQHQRQQEWIANRMERMLPVPHFHVVFTLPAELRALALANPAQLHPILFQQASSTLLTLGEQRLGGTLGVTAVLHTWGGQLQYHPHIHCIVTGGAYDAEEDAWQPAGKKYLFPVEIMRSMFRHRVLKCLQRCRDRGELAFVGGCAELEDDSAWARLRDALYRKDWVVFAKAPFRDAPALVKYLGAYTHRVAISNSRLVEITDQLVVFRDKKGRLVRLPPEEFIRRFLLHVLPSGFTKIRNYGLHSSANVNRKLPRARALLGPRRHLPALLDLLAALFLDTERRPCPNCEDGTMVRVATLPADPVVFAPRSKRRCRGPPSPLPPGFDA